MEELGLIGGLPLDLRCGIVNGAGGQGGGGAWSGSGGHPWSCGRGTLREEVGITLGAGSGVGALVGTTLGYMSCVGT